MPVLAQINISHIQVYQPAVQIMEYVKMSHLAATMGPDHLIGLYNAILAVMTLVTVGLVPTVRVEFFMCVMWVMFVLPGI